MFTRLHLHGATKVDHRAVQITALQIVNAANIQAQGNTTGAPQVQAANIDGLTEASNTAGAAAQQAVTPGQGSGNAQPSIIIVEVLGFGGSGIGDQPASENNKQRRNRPNDQQGYYDPNSMFQVVGSGELSQEQERTLTGKH